MLFNHSENVTCATRPKHVIIYSLNFVIDVNDFRFVGCLFHILGPRTVNFYRCLTVISCGCIIAFVFGVKIFFK